MNFIDTKMHGTTIQKSLKNWNDLEQNTTVHSECFQLFKTKENFLVIKISSQRESEFTRVVELNLPS